MTPCPVVMINMNTYRAFSQGVSNRNWQILQELLKRPQITQVLAVDFPPTSFKQKLRFYLKDFSLPYELIKKRSDFRLFRINEKLAVLSLPTRATCEKKITAQIKYGIDLLGIKNYLLWSYNPLLADCLGELKETKTVFDAVDNWLWHQSYQNKPKLLAQLNKNYQLIAQKADVIFTVSQDLLELFPVHKNIHWIANGVEIEHFSQAENIAEPIINLPHPIIGYHGVIQNRLDLDILEEIAKQFTTGSLVLIGPTWPMYLAKIRPKSIEKARLAKYPNVHFLKAVPYSELPRYIAGFDVGIIPHKKTKFTETMNPLKLYEYLASGKPIVATPIAGIEQFPHLIKTASAKEEFCQQIKQALSENNPALIKQRQDAVSAYSWHSRVDKILSYLNE